MPNAVVQACAKLIFGRRNEFDNAKPGPSRPMTGLFYQLEEKQKQKVLSYKGPEYAGGPKRRRLA